MIQKGLEKHQCICNTSTLIFDETLTNDPFFSYNQSLDVLVYTFGSYVLQLR